VIRLGVPSPASRRTSAVTLSASPASPPYLANGGAVEHTHKIDSKVENAIRASLASGKGLLKTTRELKVGSGTVERIRWAMAKQG
jgi:hypothetical protein